MKVEQNTDIEYSREICGGFAWIRGATAGFSRQYFYGSQSGDARVVLTWDGNTVSWYGTSAAYQLNQGDTTGPYATTVATYHYVAIG